MNTCPVCGEPWQVVESATVVSDLDWPTEADFEVVRSECSAGAQSHPDLDARVSLEQVAATIGAVIVADVDRWTCRTVAIALTGWCLSDVVREGKRHAHQGPPWPSGALLNRQVCPCPPAVRPMRPTPGPGPRALTGPHALGPW